MISSGDHDDDVFAEDNFPAETWEQYLHLPPPSLAVNMDDEESQASSSQENPEKKKKRRVLTVDQQNILEDLFTRIPNPDSHLRTVLAAQLDLPAKNIQIWFQNRRAKLKRMTLQNQAEAEATEERDVYRVEDQDAILTEQYRMLEQLVAIKSAAPPSIQILDESAAGHRRPSHPDLDLSAFMQDGVEPHTPALSPVMGNNKGRKARQSASRPYRTDTTRSGSVKHRRNSTTQIPYPSPNMAAAEARKSSISSNSGQAQAVPIPSRGRDMARRGGHPQMAGSCPSRTNEIPTLRYGCDCYLYDDLASPVNPGPNHAECLGPIDCCSPYYVHYAFPSDHALAVEDAALLAAQNPNAYHFPLGLAEMQQQHPPTPNLSGVQSPVTAEPSPRLRSRNTQQQEVTAKALAAACHELTTTINHNEESVAFDLANLNLEEDQHIWASTFPEMSHSESFPSSSTDDTPEFAPTQQDVYMHGIYGSLPASTTLQSHFAAAAMGGCYPPPASHSPYALYRSQSFQECPLPDNTQHPHIAPPPRPTLIRRRHSIATPPAAAAAAPDPLLCSSLSPAFAAYQYPTSSGLSRTWGAFPYM